jgi:hypothetical protein
MTSFRRGVFLICVPCALWACGDDDSSTTAQFDAAVEAGAKLDAAATPTTSTDVPEPTSEPTETEMMSEPDSGMSGPDNPDSGEPITPPDSGLPDEGLSDEGLPDSSSPEPVEAGPTLDAAAPPAALDASNPALDAALTLDASVATSQPIFDAAPALPEIFDALGGDATLVLACEGNCECVGNDCTCGGGSECVANCAEGEGCNLSCNGLSDCVMQCNDNCDAVCPGTSDCSVVLGPSSTASCSGTGDCSYWCEGDCDIECQGASSCSVTCQDGDASCGLDCGGAQPTDCGGGVQVCRQECPNAADAGADAGVSDASAPALDASVMDAAAPDAAPASDAALDAAAN